MEALATPKVGAGDHAGCVMAVAWAMRTAPVVGDQRIGIDGAQALRH